MTLNKLTEAESNSLKKETLFSVHALLNRFDTVSNIREQNYILFSVYFSHLDCNNFTLQLNRLQTVRLKKKESKSVFIHWTSKNACSSPDALQQTENFNAVAPLDEEGDHIT